jgi:probable phosphoglycerate mutase
MSESQEAFRQKRYQPPSGATEILLVRHGESAPAKRGESFALKDGHGDPELHPNGHAQAFQVALRLAHEPLAALYVSSLQRTAETAAPTSRLLQMEPRVEPDLREIFLGDWEGGLLRVMASENHPLYQRMHEEQEWGIVPGAETNAIFTSRVTAALTRIAACHPDEKVAAFVHGGVIGCILAHASGSQAFAFNGCNNGAISHIVLTGGRIVVRGFNDSSHLS